MCESAQNKLLFIQCGIYQKIGRSCVEVISLKGKRPIIDL